MPVRSGSPSRARTGESDRSMIPSGAVRSERAERISCFFSSTPRQRNCTESHRRGRAPGMAPTGRPTYESTMSPGIPSDSAKTRRTLVVRVSKNRSRQVAAAEMARAKNSASASRGVRE